MPVGVSGRIASAQELSLERIVLARAHEHIGQQTIVGVATLGVEGQPHRVAAQLHEIERQATRGNTLLLANRLESFTQLETRTTILGYLLRGGTPSATDRILATRLGTACAALVHENCFGLMVGIRQGAATPVPLEKVASGCKTVPLDDPRLDSARRVGTCLGDSYPPA